MTFNATIHIMPRSEILDPQGKATLQGLNKLGFTGIQDARIGKRIELRIEAADRDSAAEQLKSACVRLLANPVVEQYHFELQEA